MRGSEFERGNLIKHVTHIPRKALAGAATSSSGNRPPARQAPLFDTDPPSQEQAVQRRRSFRQRETCPQPPPPTTVPVLRSADRTRQGRRNKHGDCPGMGNQIPLGSLVFTGGRDLRPDLGLSRCKALSGSGERATRQTPVCHGARSPAARHPFGGQRAARGASWVHLRVGTGAPRGSCGMGGLEADGTGPALRCRGVCRGV